MNVSPGSDSSVSRWDVAAIRAGIGVCLLLAIPLTLLAALVDSDSSGLNALFFFGAMFGFVLGGGSAFVDSDSSGLNALFFFGAMFGFVLGGGCAAWVQRRGTPLSHGVATTIAAYVGAQSIFILIRLLRGNDVNWFGVFFTLSLVILAGVAGGILGSQLQARGFVPSGQARPQGGNR
jgi:hypothetical protein